MARAGGNQGDGVVNVVSLAQMKFRLDKLAKTLEQTKEQYEDAKSEVAMLHSRIDAQKLQHGEELSVKDEQIAALTENLDSAKADMQVCCHRICSSM